jgi:S-adenosylmethionine synthetase
MTELTLQPYESGRLGKPDRMEAAFAHLIASYILDRDQTARCNVRVSGHHSNLTGKNVLDITGEVSNDVLESVDFKDDVGLILKEHYNYLHRTSETDPITLNFDLTPQSNGLATNESTGDSGRPIAVAFKDTPMNMPWERYIAIKLRRLVDDIYQNYGAVPNALAYDSGVMSIPGIKSDGKIDVGVLFDGLKLDSVQDITAAIQHKPNLSLDELREKVTAVFNTYLNKLAKSYDVSLGNPKISVNPRGEWHEGGWKADAGSSEAKPHEDYFGNRGNMEDSPWGEDPTKPSGPGTITALHIARSIVGSDLADFVRVALTYSIGVDEVGLNITTEGTGKVDQATLEKIVRAKIPLRLRDLTNRFDLRNPEIYQMIVKTMDLFIEPSLPWNILTKLDANKKTQSVVTTLF